MRVIPLFGFLCGAVTAATVGASMPVPPLQKPPEINHEQTRDDEAQDAKESNIEAFGEWADSFKAAAQRGDKRRMEQARIFVVSLMNDIGDMQ